MAPPSTHISFQEMVTSTYLFRKVSPPLLIYLRVDGHPPTYPWGDGIYLGGDGTLLFCWRGWPRLPIYLGGNLFTYLLISRRRWPPKYVSKRRWPPTYLSRRRWSPQPTYLGEDGHQFIYPGNDGHLFTSSERVYLHIYLFIYLGGDGHPPTCLGGDGYVYLPIFLGGDGHLYHFI